MLRSILIGLDNSEYSASALTLGIRWAQRSEALLVGLGIVDQPAISRAELVPLGGAAFKEHRDQVRLAQARRQVEAILENFALRCASHGAAAKVLQDEGTPYEQVLHEAQRYDLILLGQQTHFHFATREAPCDTLQKVLKNAPRPVVAVPSTVPDAASVLVAYDGSLQAARALQAFQALELPDMGEIHVVTISSDREEAMRQAERAVDFLQQHAIQATRHVLETSSFPGEVLLEQASRLGVGLIVMGAYGKPFLHEFFLGSATQTLLEKSPVPLFLYH